MNFLSPTQLHSYENIISKIQSEEEKTQKLKHKIKKINNEIIISNLSWLKLCQKISHINVKIFGNIVELFNLYHEEINDDIGIYLKCNEDCKFYFVELFITNSLRQKLKDMPCFIYISIKGRGMLICKIVRVKQYDGPIMMILPVDKTIIDCLVSASLILHSRSKLNFVSLDNIYLNISYHFEMGKKAKFLSTDRKILEISKSYNHDLNISTIHKPLWVEYQFAMRIEGQEFANFFIKNCYHNVDFEIFSELINDSKNNFLIKFSTGSAKHSVAFDRNSRIITIKSNVSDMIQLKNYFWNEDTVAFNGEDKMKNNLKEFITLLNQSTDKDDLYTFYQNLRRIWIK